MASSQAGPGAGASPRSRAAVGSAVRGGSGHASVPLPKQQRDPGVQPGLIPVEAAGIRPVPDLRRNALHPSASRTRLAGAPLRIQTEHVDPGLLEPELQRAVEGGAIGVDASIVGIGTPVTLPSKPWDDAPGPYSSR